MRCQYYYCINFAHDILAQQCKNGPLSEVSGCGLNNILIVWQIIRIDIYCVSKGEAIDMISKDIVINTEVNDNYY